MKIEHIVLEHIPTLPPPKVSIIFIVDKPKEYVHGLMLRPKGSYTITYYLPLYSCPVEDFPDYSDSMDWRIEGEGYIVDLMQPQWHPDADSLIDCLEPHYRDALGIDNFEIVR